MNDHKKWPRSRIYRLKVELRYAALRRYGMSAKDAYREAQSVARFTAAVTSLGHDMAQYADLVKREPHAYPASHDPKKIAIRERRRHLRALGISPGWSTWYSERPLKYAALVARIESGENVSL